jgi:hypothetical protein
MVEDRDSLARTLLLRLLMGVGVLVATILLGVGVARPAEIIPSMGVTKPVDGDDDARVFAGLAVRAGLAPALATEIGVGYRSEERFDSALTTRMWPVTASLWLTPVPALYAGAGVGWYHVTLDADETLAPLAEDETRQEFGVHVGGGLRVPLAQAAAIDLQGRYVMMREQESRLVPERFDPDFWTTSVGLAIRF